MYITYSKGTNTKEKDKKVLERVAPKPGKEKTHPVMRLEFYLSWGDVNVEAEQRNVGHTGKIQGLGRRVKNVSL